MAEVPPTPAQPSRTDISFVVCDDGIRLHVEIDGDQQAPVTVVLCHGYTLSGESWKYQRAALASHARVVTFDQRGHGRSDRGALRRLTIDQLGADLFAVLEQTAPRGPVVLVGHSMGGMAILALAEQHPELFGDRIVGTALLTTSADPIRPGPNCPAHSAALHWLSAHCPPLTQRFPLPDDVVRTVRDTALVLDGWLSFAARMSPPTLAWCLKMARFTPSMVVAALLPQFVRLNKTAVLPTLALVETLVLAAERDSIITPEHSRAIAEAVPGARLMVLPNAGHAVTLEQPDQVNACLTHLLSTVTPGHPSLDADTYSHAVAVIPQHRGKRHLTPPAQHHPKESMFRRYRQPTHRKQRTTLAATVAVLATVVVGGVALARESHRHR